MCLLSYQQQSGGKSLMSEHCGSNTEDGSAVCVPGACSCSSEAKSKEPIVLSVPAKNKKIISFNQIEENSMWKKIRAGFMFVVAFVTSPCCTPLIVPLGLALLAGTPVAVWLSANVGWVYGGLTLISIASFVLAYRWMGNKAQSKNSIRSIEPVHEINQ